MQYGIVTQIQQWGSTLDYLVPRRWEAVRLDVPVGYREGPEKTLDAIRQANEAGLQVYLTIRDPTWPMQLRNRGIGREQLWGIGGTNESDIRAGGGYMTVAQQIDWINRFAANVAEADLDGWVGMLSNFNTRGFDRLAAIMPTIDRYPHLGIDMHWYSGGEGHEGGNWAAVAPETNSTREGAIARLKRIIRARKWLVGEFGFHTTDITPQQQALEIRRMYEFVATTDAVKWFYFQLNRDESLGPIGKFGLLRENGTWLPGVDALMDLPEGPTQPEQPPEPGQPPAPPEPGPIVITTPERSVTMRVGLRLNGKAIGCEPHAEDPRRGDEQFPVYADRENIQSWEELDRTPSIDQPGSFNYRLISSNRALCLNYEGKLETRKAGTKGGWETFKQDGMFVYRVENGRVLGGLTLEYLDNVGAEQGWIRARGTQFVDEQGQPWGMRGYSIHTWLNTLVHEGEEAFKAMLRDVLSIRLPDGTTYNAILGINTHLAPYKTGWPQATRLDPEEHSDYYDKLDRAITISGEMGVRLAPGILADMQYARRGFDRQRHFRRSCEVMRGRWNVLVARKGNEAGVNGWAEEEFQFPDMGGVMTSQGQAGIDTPPHKPFLHVVEFSPTRGPKWLLDSGSGLRQIYMGDTQWGKVEVPLINAEPMYFHDTNVDEVGDHRNDNPKDALALGVASMSNCEGLAFGASHGLIGRPLQARARLIAYECLRGMKAGFVR